MGECDDKVAKWRKMVIVIIKMISRKEGQT